MRSRDGLCGRFAEYELEVFLSNSSVHQPSCMISRPYQTHDPSRCGTPDGGRSVQFARCRRGTPDGIEVAHDAFGAEHRVRPATLYMLGAVYQAVGAAQYRRRCL
jgi:hypothetical protein